MKARTNRKHILYVCQAGIVAALYTVLTCVVGELGLANGVVQFRVSEALCVMPVFFPAAIPGLTVGCVISNLITSKGMWQDVVFGSLATLIGALGAYLLRKAPAWLTTAPTILANALIVPPILVYAYHMEGGLPFITLTVTIGELLSAGVLGTLLCILVRRRNLFGQRHH
ncbi:MAG TPA: transporter [Clostridiales bacterium]|nr:transporter [Clostridiales bacterium]